VNDPHDPFQNLMGSAKYLKGHLEATGGDVRGALWRYNAGQGNYARNILPQETKNYIQNITQQPLPDGFGARELPKEAKNFLTDKLGLPDKRTQFYESFGRVMRNKE